MLKKNACSRNCVCLVTIWSSYLFHSFKLCLRRIFLGVNFFSVLLVFFLWWNTVEIINLIIYYTLYRGLSQTSIHQKKSINLLIYKKYNIRSINKQKLYKWVPYWIISRSLIITSLSNSGNLPYYLVNLVKLSCFCYIFFKIKIYFSS